MLESAILFIEKIVITHGVWGLFLAGIIEEIIAPIPSSVVIMGGGFIILGGQEVSLINFSILFFQVVVPVSLGLMVGSAIIYYIFYYIGEPALKRFGKYLGISFEDLLALKERMSKSSSDEVFIFTVRALPIFPIVLVNIFCGLMKYSPVKFFVISFVGILVRATLVGFLGWQLGVFYKRFAMHIQIAEDYVTVVVVASLLLYFIYRHYKNRKLIVKPLNKA